MPIFLCRISVTHFSTSMSMLAQYDTKYNLFSMKNTFLFESGVSIIQAIFELALQPKMTLTSSPP